MANVYHGVGVHWGTSSTTSTTLGTLKLQSRDHEKKSEMEAVKDGDGITVGKIYYDQMDEATFEYIPTSSTVNGTLTPTLPAIGDLISISDTTYTAIAGATWICESVSTKSSNTSALRATVKLVKYQSITA
jgi:hypothetical protein